MADLTVVNSLNYKKAVKFNVTFRHFVVKGQEGEYMWLLEVGTTYPDANGENISAKKVLNVSAENLDEVIEDAVADLCSKIDWSPLVEDKESPYVESSHPLDGSTVPISSYVLMTIKDRLPSSGVDMSAVKVILNNSMTDFDITSDVEIRGDPYEYKVKWVTPLRVYKRYED
jgi:hypothetical protein